MSLLSRPKHSKGSCYQKITPQSANWDFVGFEAHDLRREGGSRLGRIETNE